MGTRTKICLWSPPLKNILKQQMSAITLTGLPFRGKVFPSDHEYEWERVKRMRLEETYPVMGGKKS